MSQSTAKLVLTRAREMIESPELWLQGAWKQQLPGGGYRRCAYQAVRDAAELMGLPDGSAFKALLIAAGAGRKAPRRVIPVLNDRSSHGEMLGLFDRALENV